MMKQKISTSSQHSQGEAVPFVFLFEERALHLMTGGLSASPSTDSLWTPQRWSCEKPTMRFMQDTGSTCNKAVGWHQEPAGGQTMTYRTCTASACKSIAQ
eukprot:2286089-Amphidinium_carterae.1